MYPKQIIRLSFLIFLVNGDDLIGKFANDYFSRLNIRQIVAFACWNNEETVEFSRTIMRGDKSVISIAIEDGLEMATILKVNYYKLGVILDLDCPRSERIFDQFQKQRLRHNESYFWLMPMEGRTIPNYFEKLPLNIATEMTVAVRENDGFVLYDVYNPSYRHGGKLNVTYMGSWKVGKGLNIELTQYKYKRRGNLYGLSLNASIAIDHPTDPDFNTYIHNPIRPHLDTMHRYNYALTLQVRDYYNFTMNLSRGTTWGYLINGTFNGIIGDMCKGLIDFGATPFQFKPERLDVIEFTVQTWLARPCFIFRHPKKDDLRNPFLKPLETKVWYLIAVFSLFNWCLLYATSKVENKYDSRIPENTLDTHPASEISLITTAAVCQQGLSDGPRCISGRITFISLFLWGLMLYQFYSASIVGSLLSKQPYWITTLKDLLDSNLEIGIEEMAYNHDFFATTTDPVAQELYRQKVAINKKRKKLPYFTAGEGLKLMQKGGFAFHVDVATAYKLIEETFNDDEICDLVEIQLFPPKHTATGTAKHSPFKKMITYGMRQVMEHGMGRRLRHIWMHRRPTCPESHNADPSPVILKEFSPALMLLCAGVGFAVFVMILEMVHQRSSYAKDHRIDLSPDVEVTENSVVKSNTDSDITDHE